MPGGAAPQPEECPAYTLNSLDDSSHCGPGASADSLKAGTSSPPELCSSRLVMPGGGSELPVIEGVREPGEPCGECDFKKIQGVCTEQPS